MLPTFVDAQWWRWWRPKKRVVVSDAQSLPLLQNADIEYLGAFRVPRTNNPTSNPNANFSGGTAYAAGGHYLAYNPASGTLYVSGWNSGPVAEITIPTPSLDPDFADLPIASFTAQEFHDISQGNIAASTAINPAVQYTLTGLSIMDGKLFGSMTSLYGDDDLHTFSIFTHSLTLATSSFAGSKVKGSGAGGYPTGTSWNSGHMTAIPTVWQPLLGGTMLSGQCCVSIASRTSIGPAAWAYNSADIGVTANINTAVPLVFYNDVHPTLGEWEDQNDTWGAVSFIRGMTIVTGTRTLLYWGRNATGDYCYGIIGPYTGADPGHVSDYYLKYAPTSVSGLHVLEGDLDDGLPGISNVGSARCYDPAPKSKGQSAWPYTFQFWAYDLNDLAKVKAGTTNPGTGQPWQPWDVVPYGVWLHTSDFALPVIDASGGLAYDAVNQKIYVAQLDVVSVVIAQEPVIHVYKLNNIP